MRYNAVVCKLGEGIYSSRRQETKGQVSFRREVYNHKVCGMSVSQLCGEDIRANAVACQLGEGIYSSGWPESIESNCFPSRSFIITTYAV